MTSADNSADPLIAPGGGGVWVSLVLHTTPPATLQHTLTAVNRSRPSPSGIRLHANGDVAAAQLPDVGAQPGDLPLHVSAGDNVGFAAAHNRLLGESFAAGADLVVVLNPDLVLDPPALGALAQAARARPRALLGPVLWQSQADGAATGLVDTLGIRWTRDGRHLDVGHGEPAPDVLPVEPWRVAGISGACLAVPRAAYQRIVTASGEFFDEDFFAYREDAELALRAGLLGIESWIVPQATGLHVRSQRGTTRGRDPFVDLLGVRNRFLLALKWGRRRPGRLPLVLLRDVIVVVAVLLHERSSLDGLRQAWRLRRRMREKRRRVLAQLGEQQRSTP